MTEQRSEEHTSELQSRLHLVCRLLLEKKNIEAGGNLGANQGGGIMPAGAIGTKGNPGSICWNVIRIGEGIPALDIEGTLTGAHELVEPHAAQVSGIHRRVPKLFADPIIIRPLSHRPARFDDRCPDIFRSGEVVFLGCLAMEVK